MGLITQARRANEGEVILDGEHSVLFATHIIDDLERIADYIVMVEDGKVLMQDEMLLGMTMMGVGALSMMISIAISWMVVRNRDNE